MTQQNKSPAFQFYPKDFLSDLNVMQMSNAQKGAYWTLISICWIQDGLPKDEDILARLVGEDEGWWSENGGLIRACFKMRGNKLIHPRLQNEKIKQKNRRTKAQLGANKTNAKRYAKQQDSSHSERIANASPRSSSPSPSSTPVINTHNAREDDYFVLKDFMPDAIQQRQLKGRKPDKNYEDELTRFKAHRFKNPVRSSREAQGLWTKWWLEDLTPLGKPKAVGAIERIANGGTLA